MESYKTNWRTVDHRIKSLSIVIDGLQTAINGLEDQVKQGGWYDGLWFSEEAEPIYGLGFIAFQHYINGSIKDRFGNVKSNEYYETDLPLSGDKKSTIKLIIALANYAKHKEEGKFHNHTRESLDNFHLKCDPEIDITDSPILAGIELLSSKGDLNDVLDYVARWRDFILTNNEPLELSSNE
jgi:hypothetical protein